MAGPAMRQRTRLTALLLAILLACTYTFIGAAAAEASSEHADASSSLLSLSGTLRLPPAASSTSSSSFAHTRLLLNGGEQIFFVRADGSFRVTGLRSGATYTLDVASADYEFAPLRIEVSSKGGSGGSSGKNRIQVFTLHGKQKVPLPLVLRPVFAAEYFAKREPVNLLAWFKNPMVILMGITLIMAVVMPRMMANMNPEELAEMQKMQSQFSLEGLKKKLEEKTQELAAQQQQPATRR